MTKTINQQVLIRAKPDAVFEALMDEAKHAAFTGNAARISRQPGGPFTCYGEYITGFTLEAVPSRRIVQAWRSENWLEGVYSIVSFKLSKAAGGRTKLNFCQIGVPANDYARKSKGWRTHYWEPLKRFLEARGD